MQMDMDETNVAQLAVPQTQPLERRDHIQGADREAEFLSLKLLNKRSRVRLSPNGIDYSRLPGNSSLFAVGNIKGYFAAATCQENSSHHILMSSLSDLRTAFESDHTDPDPFIPFRAATLSVPGTPAFLRFALNDDRLVIAFLEGPVLVYSSEDVLGSSPSSQPSHLFAFQGDASTLPKDILPNPGESPELVAIKRWVHGQDPGYQIDVIDVQKLKHVAGWRKSSDPTTSPVSVSWSPKGKQIAIGLQSGDILLYSPLSAGSPKSHLVKPVPTPADAPSLFSITWLSNPTFHTVYSTPEASSALFDPSLSDPSTLCHFITAHDSKSRSAVDVELRDPCPPFGARRPPGLLSVVLRNWNPTKLMIFCGGGPSSDIGLIGFLPSNDVSRSEDQWANLSLEETSTPSLPLDEELNDLALLALEMDLTSSKPIRMSEQPDDDTPDHPASPILYAYMSDGSVVAWHIINTSGETYPGMKPGGTAESMPTDMAITDQRESAKHVGTPSPPPTAFEQPPSMVNQSPRASSPPRPSAFGQSSGVIAPAKGFGAFASTNAAAKSGSGFGFASGAPTPSVFGQPKPSPAFGSTGFGGGGASEGEQPTPKPSSAFGTPGFGGDGAAQATQQRPAPPFGTTGFGQARTTPVFGASSFGSKPAAPVFGQSGFGALPSSAAKPPSTFGSTGGGFASFANKGSSAFGAPVDTTSSTQQPKATSSPAFGQASLVPSSPPFTSESAAKADSLRQATPPASVFGSGGVGQAPRAASPLSGAFGQQATQLPSALGGSSQPGGTQTSQPSSFGPSTPSPPRETGGLAGFGALGEALQSSPAPAKLESLPGSPPSPTGSSPDSPELRPVSLPVKPASSYLRPATGFGSFNKPASGSGAFSASAKPSSAFTKPAEGSSAPSLEKMPGSALDPQKQPTPSATPVFGSTSALGQQKPVFGASSFGSAPQLAAEPAIPITGGFSAFSSGGGGFASFANAGSKTSSFADILSAGDPDKPKRDSTTPLAFGAAPSSKSNDTPALSVPTQRDISPTPMGDPIETLPPQETKAGADESDGEPEEGKERFSEERLTDQEPSAPTAEEQDPSLSLLSLEEVTSKVPPSTSRAAPAPPTEVGPEMKGEVQENSKVSEQGDEAASELFSLTDDSFEESDEGDRQPGSPAGSIPEKGEASHPPSQDRTKEPTQTPEPEQATQGTEIRVDKISSTADERPPGNADVENTTPPGSPDTPVIASQQSLATNEAPSPTTPVSTSSPFGLGVGRLSSRPIRSSPLASTPITNTDDDASSLEVTPSKSAPPAMESQPAEPRVVPGKLPPSTPAPSTAPPLVPGNTSLGSMPRRPKTPPPLKSPSSMPSALPQTSDTIASEPKSSLTAPKPPTTLPVKPHVVPPPIAASASSTEVEEKTEEIPQHPMQVEFLRAYHEVMKELVQLYKKIQETTIIRPIISKPRGLDKFVLSNQEFVPGQYSHGDLKAFTTMTGTLQENVVPLFELGNANKLLLRDLQNLVMISETKQEEVSRWVRARQDPDFSDAIKPHELGPEHAEDKFRLRKAIQAARDRVQRCEDVMESLKKRLDKHRSGKVGLRPPSLDTIDRTCRNIQIALEERVKLLEQLQDRIEALSPKDSRRLQESRARSGLPASSPASRTPSFASIAAAALNSERSSLKLKTALHSAHKEPLLTTKITKTQHSRGVESMQPQRPDWKLPPVPPLDSSGSPQMTSRRTGRPGKKHGAVPLKAGTPPAGTKTLDFDWGPLPGAAPRDKLSFDVRNPGGRDTKV